MGSITNPDSGNLSLGFTTGGENLIAGMTLYLEPGEMDWEGFTIDDLIFSFAPDSTDPDGLVGVSTTGSGGSGTGGSDPTGSGVPGSGTTTTTPEPATLTIWAILGVVCVGARRRGIL